MFNEKDIIESCASSLSSALEEFSEKHRAEYEIIFSDDGSTDGSGDIILRYKEKTKLPHGVIRLVSSAKNCGKGHAVRLGMLEADGDYMLFTDSDLAYGTAAVCDILDMISSPDNTSDIVIGSRAASNDGYRGYSTARKIASKTYVKFLSAFAGFDHTDSQCGIKAFRKDAAKKLFGCAKECGWAFDFEILLLAKEFGISVDEYPVSVINHRESKIHLLHDSLKMLSDVRQIKKRIKNIH